MISISLPARKGWLSKGKKPAQKSQWNHNGFFEHCFSSKRTLLLLKALHHRSNWEANEHLDRSHDQRPNACFACEYHSGRAGQARGSGSARELLRWTSAIWIHCGPRRNTASRCFLERGSSTAAFLAAAEAECRAGAAASSPRSPTRARGAGSASSFADCEVCKCNILFVTARCARLLPSLSALM